MYHSLHAKESRSEQRQTWLDEKEYRGGRKKDVPFFEDGAYCIRFVLYTNLNYSYVNI